MNVNRRLLLSTALGCAVAPAWAAAGTAYEVAPWPAGTPLPQLQGTDLAGRPWRVSDLRGRAVLLNFWATWCEPCRSEMPSLEQLAQRYAPGELAVIAINFKQSVAAVRNFMKSTALALPVVLDPDGANARALDVHVFPTTLLIAPDGSPRFRVRGEMDWTAREADRLVSQLLAH